MKLSPVLIVAIGLLGAAIYTSVDAKTKTAQLPQPPQASPSPSPTPSASPSVPAASPSPTPSPISQQEQEQKVLQAYQGEQKPSSDQPASGDEQGQNVSTFVPTHKVNCWLSVKGELKECYARIRPEPSRATDTEVGQAQPGEEVMALNKRVYSDGRNWVYVINKSGEQGWVAESILKRIGD